MGGQGQLLPLGRRGLSLPPPLGKACSRWEVDAGLGIRDAGVQTVPRVGARFITPSPGPAS